MEYFGYIVLFLLGSIIGSFLNVVIYRLHTGKSFNGRSHCMSCGTTLTWPELFPLFSYIVLRGRCNVCSAHIPSRYFVVELLTGMLYMLVWYLFAPQIMLVILNLILISLCVVIIVYDILHTIIPNELIVLVGIVAVIFLGQSTLQSGDYTIIVNSVIGGLCAFIFFWGLWFISKGRWIGLGDAKLALPLAFIVGATGVFTMVVLSFWIGALVSLILLAMQWFFKRGKMGLHFHVLPFTIKSEIPFAPFLVAGFLLVHFFHANILTLSYIFFST